MKVLIVMQGVPHPSSGASLVVYFNYIAELINAGFDVLTISQGVVEKECKAAIDECKQAINWFYSRTI